MARNALKAKDIPLHKQRLVEARTKARRSKQVRASADLTAKTFDQLTSKEKDDLLKVLLLKAGLISYG